MGSKDLSMSYGAWGRPKNQEDTPLQEHEHAGYMPVNDSSESAQLNPLTSKMQPPGMAHDPSLLKPEDAFLQPQQQQQQKLQHHHRHTHHYRPHHHLPRRHLHYPGDEVHPPPIPPRRSSFTASSGRKSDGGSDDSSSSIEGRLHHNYHGQPPNEAIISASRRASLLDTPEALATATTTTTTTRENVSPAAALRLPPTLSLTGSAAASSSVSSVSYPLKREKYQQRRGYGIVESAPTGPMHRKTKRPRGAWKKLLWVKQSYPDNYTDTETFLDHLQRNPRLRPYDFWPLMADFTVITQHVCSVVIFLCCFIGIFQERISPVAVVSWGTVCSILGWVLWDFWVGREEQEAERKGQQKLAEAMNDDLTPSSMTPSAGNTLGDVASVGSADTSTTIPNKASDRASEPTPEGVITQPDLTGSGISDELLPPQSSSSIDIPRVGLVPSPENVFYPPLIPVSPSGMSPRTRQRLATAKSALLIFCALMGLSPILKSLTKSTTSDSIWAMSCWLLIINIFFFDYGSGERSPAAKFPASLSTNAALMASTVLASRLPSTTHVFSLTLFSIEVFGLFPVFRRQLRAISWRGHVFLTVALVVFAGAAIGLTTSRSGCSFIPALTGIVLFGIGTALTMGICSWWLISLQKYKNVVIGPWDPARPVLRRRWDF